MKIFLSILLITFSTLSFAEINQYSVVFGGWSKHFNDDYNFYNEKHHSKGVEIGSNEQYIGLYRFKNSYHKQSHLVSYHHNKCGQKYKLNYCYGGFVGYVSGYSDFNIIGAPEIVLTYQLSDDISLGGTASCLPGVCATTLKLTIKK